MKNAIPLAVLINKQCTLDGNSRVQQYYAGIYAKGKPTTQHSGFIDNVAVLPELNLSRDGIFSEILLNPILHGGDQNDPPRLIIVQQSSWNALNGLIFHDFVPFNIKKSWVGHFWDFFLKFPKNFTSTLFSKYNPKEGPFYTCKNAFIFGSFLGSKMVVIQLQMPK